VVRGGGCAGISPESDGRATEWSRGARRWLSCLWLYGCGSGAVGGWRRAGRLAEEAREVGVGLEAGFVRNLGDRQIGAFKKAHGATDAQGNLVFERRHAVVFAEPLPEKRVTHAALLGNGRVAFYCDRSATGLRPVCDRSRTQRIASLPLRDHVPLAHGARQRDEPKRAGREARRCVERDAKCAAESEAFGG